MPDTLYIFAKDFGGPVIMALFAIGTLYVRKTGRDEAMTVVATELAKSTEGFKQLIRAEFAESRVKLLETLQGYRLVKDCEGIERAATNQADKLEEKIGEIREYAYGTKHELTSRIYGLDAQVSALIKVSERGGD
jgi:hypothetical protein